MDDLDDNGVMVCMGNEIDDDEWIWIYFHLLL